MKKTILMLLFVLLSVQLVAGCQQQKMYTYDSGLQSTDPDFTITITIRFANGSLTSVNDYNLTVTEYVNARLVSTSYNITTIIIPAQVNHFRIVEQSVYDLKVKYTNDLNFPYATLTSPNPVSGIKHVSQSDKTTSMSMDTTASIIPVLLLAVLRKRIKKSS